ncbi:MAG: NAD(P)H-hydrate dehydratase [Thermodesulfobacteriota bacterium]
MYLVTADEMQAMDRMTMESFGLPGRLLMENAGRGAVRMLLEWMPEALQQRIGIVAGRGNNGGDGFVMARYLAQLGADITVFLLAEKDRIDGDAGANLRLLEALSVEVLEAPDGNRFQDCRRRMQECRVWVDAILGTGLRSEVKGLYHAVIDFLNRTERPVFSVDIPSGLNADTGQPHGICIRAAATATFGFAKTGHMLYPGADCTGRLGIVDIGIPDHIRERINPRQVLITPELLRESWVHRKPDAHKGDTGHLLVVAGSTGKTGAAALCSLSAMRAGAGLVTLGVPESINSLLEPQVLEMMTEPLPEKEPGHVGEAACRRILELLEGKKGFAVGPGLGRAETTRKMLQRILPEIRVPMVIDADGLTLLEGATDLLKQITAPVILTPHPGEMARLTGMGTRMIQLDRVACARRFAEEFGVLLVLKGAGTVVADPAGKVYVNPTGNSGMAAGGMGDVLTGIIAGLLAQGFDPVVAATAGVYLHGAAADLTAAAVGGYGYQAGQVADALPRAVSRLLNRNGDGEGTWRLPEQRGL